MTAIRSFEPLDLFKFNLTNLDSLTETYDIGFYLSYIARWPSMFNVVEGQDGEIQAYLMGKTESSPEHYRHSEHWLPWHAHITALTVAPQARRQGLARLLTENMERSGDEYNAWFVDLFVRKSNKLAIDMYSKMGYSVFRRVLAYYSDDPTGIAEEEDALDMRKPLSRDKKREHVRGSGQDFTVEPMDVW
ncbi:MAG: hypothetical protein M1833_004979 [Piccolia ochrophora]|nr:MAG: hypothetical protein M1833_004979 [Piccolia ochrophora]